MSSEHVSAARHPGEVLAEVLAGRGVTAYRIAAIMHIPYERTYAVVTGRRKITPDTALRLECALGEPSAEYWLGLQASYDLVLAREAAGASLGSIEPVDGSAAGGAGAARAAE